MKRFLLYLYFIIYIPLLCLYAWASMFAWGFYTPSISEVSQFVIMIACLAVLPLVPLWSMFRKLNTNTTSRFNEPLPTWFFVVILIVVLGIVQFYLSPFF